MIELLIVMCVIGALVGGKSFGEVLKSGCLTTVVIIVLALLLIIGALSK